MGSTHWAGITSSLHTTLWCRANSLSWNYYPVPFIPHCGVGPTHWAGITIQFPSYNIVVWGQLIELKLLSSSLYTSLWCRANSLGWNYYSVPFKPHCGVGPTHWAQITIQFSLYHIVVYGQLIELELLSSSLYTTLWCRANSLSWNYYPVPFIPHCGVGPTHWAGITIQFPLYHIVVYGQLIELELLSSSLYTTLWCRANSLGWNYYGQKFPSNHIVVWGQLIELKQLTIHVLFIPHCGVGPTHWAGITIQFNFIPHRGVGPTHWAQINYPVPFIPHWWCRANYNELELLSSLTWYHIAWCGANVHCSWNYWSSSTLLPHCCVGPTHWAGLRLIQFHFIPHCGVGSTHWAGITIQFPSYHIVV